MTGGNISIPSDAGDKFRSAFQIDSLQQAQDAVNNLDGLWSSGAHDFAKRDQFDDAAQAVKRRFESGSYKPGTLVQDPPPAKDPPAGAPAETRHIASATTWKAICVEPDWCKVGDKPIPFDSFATINQEDRASPNVKARGVPVYRLGDTHKGTEANAGAHVVSQTSQGSGYVKVLNEDQHGVKANGIPVARDKTPCLVNCDANGVGGALGMLQTDYKTMFRVRTQDDWKADRQYFEDAKKHADEEGKRISRELDKAKAELDKTSWYRPSQWAQRSEIKDRISSLESQLQARGRDSIYYRDQMNHAFEMAFPESAGGPVMSAGPSWTEQREIGRQVEMQRRNEARLNAATQSPFAMAGAAFAEGMGGDAQAMEGMAQAFDGIAQARAGRLAMEPGPRPRPLASRSVRRGRGQGSGGGTPKPPATQPGVYVSQTKVANGYTFEMDSLGRVTKSSGDLTLNKSQGRNTKAQLEAGGADRLSTDQGGHYIGRRFNGPTEPFNHFAQNGNFNNSSYKILENSWQKMLEAGQSVRVEIVPTFVGNSLRPASLTVRQWIDGVPRQVRVFQNAAGG